jgi:hypothetical protein
MTTANEPRDPRQPAGADRPGDIPAGRPAALSRLDALLGEWEMEVSFEAGYFGPGSPPVAGRGGSTRGKCRRAHAWFAHILRRPP